MTIKVIERPKQAGTMQFKGSSASREYVLSGSTSKLAIQIAIANAAPGTENTIDAKGDTLSLYLNKIDVKEVGGGVWEATCSYNDTPSQWDLKFNIGTQTTKRQQALKHIRTYDCVLGGHLDGPGGFTSDIPDFKGAIGVTGSGSTEEVAGVDVEIAKVEFTITLKIPFATLVAAYFTAVANITPCVNITDFALNFKGQTFAFPRGSVLFRGAPMSVDSDAMVTFTYMFAYSRNLTAEQPEWVATTTYALGAQVYFGGYIWSSAAGGNLNNQPVPDGWVSTGIYMTGDQVSRSGHNYTSRVDNNEGNDPALNPVQWTDNGVAPWNLVGPAVGQLTVGNSDPIIAEGWWYKWPWYRTTVTGNTAHPVPVALVIDQVYDYGDFQVLQIPDQSN